jgi:hypothetical protein
VPYYGPCEMFEMVLFLTSQKTNLFAGYYYGYALNPYVALSPTSGGAGCHGFWMQPFEDGSTGFIQLVRLAA